MALHIPLAAISLIVGRRLDMACGGILGRSTRTARNAPEAACEARFVA